jgi:hypothetical protein
MNIVCDILMYYVLFVYNNRTRFWIICWVLGICGFRFGFKFSLELIFWLDLDFRFRCPDTIPNPTHCHL